MSMRCLLAGATMLAGLSAAAGAAAQGQTTVIYHLPEGRYQLVTADRATGALAYVPRSPAADLNQGMWGAQPITPPAGLVLVEQGDLIGRGVKEGGGDPFGTIRRLLVDPGTGLAHYAVVSTPENATWHYVVPMSAIDTSTMRIGMAARDISLLPAHSLADLQERYPPARLSASVITGPVVMAPAGAVIATAPRTGTTTIITVPPYRLTQAGDWVGRAALDHTGELIGVVDYLLTDPATGVVRQAAVTGGVVGRGDYVLIPVENLRLSAGRLVADWPAYEVLRQPRLSENELALRYGPALAAR